MSYNSGGTSRGVLHLTAPTATPLVAPAGEGRIYFDGTVFQVSENGGAFVPIATPLSAAGWTDDGTVVRLTTVTDGVGIGTASPAATSKLEVLGDATRLNVVATGGNPGGAGTGGAVTLVGGTGGTTGIGGALSASGGSGGSTSGAGGAMTLAGGGSTSGTGGACLVRGGDPTTGVGGEGRLRGGNAGGANAGGAAVVIGGVGGTTGVGGAAFLFGGAGGSSSGVGGAVTVQPGGGTGASAGGALALNGGNGGTTGAGGAVSIFGGAAGISGTAVGGTLTILGGSSSGAGAAGPPIIITGGSCGSATGGAVTITGGAPTAGTNVGGAVSLTGGVGFGAGVGGATTLQAGAGGATGTGGSTTVRGGVGGSTSGAGGVLFLDGGPGGVAAAVGGAITLRTAAAGTGTTLTERARVDSVGTLFLGDGTAAAAIVAAAPSQSLTSYRNSSNNAGFYAFSATATDQMIFNFVRARGTAAVPAIVAAGDALGLIQFATFVTASTTRVPATISAVCEGTPSITSAAGRLAFSTTLDGAAAPTERARINNIGTLLIGDGTLSTVIGGSGVANTPWSAYRNSAVLLEARAFSATATDGSILNLRRYRGTAAASTITADNDTIGAVRFHPANATNGTNQAAQMVCENDGTPTASSTPTRIRWDTCPAGTLTVVERMRINNLGTTFLGDGTLSASFNGGGSAELPFLAYRNSQCVVTADAYSAVATDSGVWSLRRGRGTAAAPAAVTTNDYIGRMLFQGTISASSNSTFAEIRSEVDGAVGVGDSPGRLLFLTTPDGSGTAVERMRINNLGTTFLGDGTISSAWDPGAANEPLSIYRNTSGVVYLQSISAAAASDCMGVGWYRGRGTAAAPAIAAANDRVTVLSFGVVTGATTGSGCGSIEAFVDGTPGIGDTPGRIVVSTTPDGSAIPVERMRINNLGTTFLGDGTLISGFGGSGAASTALHAYRNSTTSLRAASFTAASAADSSYLVLERSRGTAASPAAVTSGDVIGGVSFQGATTTTDTRTFADIVCEADGTVGGLNDAPGRLRFLTTPDGSGTPAERVRIVNDGSVGVATTTPIATLDVDGSVSAGDVASVATNTTLDATHSVVLVDASGGAITITLPAVSGLARRRYTIKKTDSSANAVTVDGSGAETIDGATTQSLATQYDALEIVTNGTEWFIV